VFLASFWPRKRWGYL